MPTPPTLGSNRPLTFLIPNGAGLVEILDDIAALRMGLLDRTDLGLLRDSGWDGPGVYILMAKSGNTWRVYVGKAPAGIRTRLRSHDAKKEFWERALLVQRDTTNGFSSSHAAWLEGRLFRALSQMPDVTLENKQTPGDDTLPPHEIHMLETVVEPVVNVLRVVGLPVDQCTKGVGGNGAQISDSLGGRKRAHYGVSLTEIVDAGLLTIGSELHSTQKSAPAVARITSEGRIEYAGRVFDSPSMAGSEARGGKATNGWTFWAVRTLGGMTPLSALRDAFLLSID